MGVAIRYSRACNKLDNHISVETYEGDFLSKNGEFLLYIVD